MAKIKVPSLLIVGAVLIGFLMGSGLSGQVHAESEGLLGQLHVFNQVLRYIKTNYVEEVDSQDLVNSAIDGMLEQLDPHSTYVNPESFSRMNERNSGEYEGIGISFEMRDGYITVVSAIEGGPSYGLGIRPGDRIVAIEGESAKDLNSQDVVSKLKGPKGTKVNISVARPGLDKELAFTIVRDKIPIYSIPYTFMLDDGKTGYLRMIRFSATTSEELTTALRDLESQGMERLILDLRNNSGGFLNQAIEVSDKFIDGNEVVVYTKGRIDGASQYYYSTDDATFAKYPLIVLVNHGSASASEIVSGAVQDHDRGLVAGVTTFGKGLVQRQYMLSDGGALLLTVARYYTPSGRLIQRPYEDRDEYLDHFRLADQDEDGNAVAQAPADTTEKPVFYTLNEKRVVYGGGGITPDVEINLEREFNEIQVKLEQSQLFFEFAAEYVATHFDPATLNATEFVRDYQVTDATIDEFDAQALATDVVELSREELDAEREYIRAAIKRELAGNMWGINARYQVYVKDDPVLSEALTHFPEAVEMAKIYERGWSTNNR